MGNQESIKLPSPVHIVLVGGGHANVQVLKELSKRFVIDKDHGFYLTLISDYKSAYYSGMLPGSISSLYQPEEIQIDLVGLCNWCGVEFIHDKMTSINWDNNTICCQSGNNIKFDYAIINIGSETRQSELPGVKEYAITTRPISKLLQKIEERDKVLNSIRETKKRKVIVVGSGAAGLELAWSFKKKLLLEKMEPEITLIHGGDKRIFEEYGPFVSSNVYKKLEEHHITIVQDKAIEVKEDKLVLNSKKELEFDYLVWATGAKAPNVLQNTGLTLDDNGYILVNKYLQSVSHSNVFAVGDCCNFNNMNLPKAGVYSVREGPAVTENIVNILLKQELKEYKPQSGFLALLNTSDGEAISSWKGTSFTSSWIMKQKDRIDRKFMDAFKPPPGTN